MSQADTRLQNYNYLQILKNFLGDDFNNLLSGKLLYPRQIEVHLPGDHKRACDFKCYYCQGGLLNQALGMDEKKVLRLMDQIDGGKNEYYIFGGAYTEPLLNPYLIDFIRMSKKHKVNFGIHTSGSKLKQLEEEKGFLTETFKIMDKKDYVSVSLDAGTPESHMKTKGLNTNYFDDIIEGIRMMAVLQQKNPELPAVRICYLLNQFNSSEEEIQKIVDIANELKVDSLRFSIPYDLYGKPFEQVRKYKQGTELPQNRIYEKRLEKFASKGFGKKPHIFYFSPVNQDVDRMDYQQCVYTYYQITIAADGNVYRCSSIASPTFSYGILGPTPGTREEFEKLILKAQDPNFNCMKCFNAGARCNRLALEINSAYNLASDTICKRK